MGNAYHIPVLCKELANLLITDINGVYVDGTLGGGGHAEYILRNLSDRARYIALDMDIDAIEFSRKRLQRYKNISFYQSNFRDLAQILKMADISSIAGVLLDLGVSSHQIDIAERGFSYLLDGKLDMRMNNASVSSASDLLNNLDVDELSRIFFTFGEERNARKIARSIIEERRKKPITSSEELRKIIDRQVHPRFAIKSYARIFQALRIAVNEELLNLTTVLQSALSFLQHGGRIAVIAYHSLEDRIVKNFLRENINPCICPPEFPECICGRMAKMKAITKKPLRASDQEIKQNPRARSALLRVGEVL
jgi:16S rRNA (cytosine1402-N4)-methyltransferase